MNVCVTGGAGFVGSALSQKLIEEGHVVTIVDNLSNGKSSNIPEKATFIKEDIANDTLYTQIEKKSFDVIYHVAAQASNAISFRNPILDLESNLLGTVKLLEFARHTGCNRFIFTSSMSAYGNPSIFPTTENEPLKPTSPYGCHKAASEQYVRIYGNEYGLKWTIFRLYTTYGSTQNLDNLDQGLLSIYLAYLLKNKPIIVKGSLTRKRDIIHVSDVVSALTASLSHTSTIGETYNLSNGTSLSIRELLDELIRHKDKDPLNYPIEVLDGTPGDPVITWGSIEKAKKHFNFSPKITPIEGIKMTVTWEKY